MNINYNPLRIDDLNYKIDGEIIYIKHKENVYKADFTGYVDGKLNTLLEFIPSAEKTNGELTVTLKQPVDNEGIPIKHDNDFEIDEFEEIAINWKTQEEIEAEKNAPKPLTEIEQLKLEQAQANAELFEMMLMLTGGGL